MRYRKSEHSLLYSVSYGKGDEYMAPVVMKFLFEIFRLIQVYRDNL